MRADDNQAEIVGYLRKMGISVQVLSQVGGGCPDILVGYNGRNYLMEIKSGKSRLSRRQKEWHGGWCGQSCVIRTIQEALNELQKHDR